MRARCWRRPGRDRTVALPILRGVEVLFVAYFNLVHAGVAAIGRYAVPLIPYYFLLAVATVRLLTERWRRMGAPAEERIRA